VAAGYPVSAFPFYRWQNSRSTIRLYDDTAKITGHFIINVLMSWKLVTNSQQWIMDENNLKIWIVFAFHCTTYTSKWHY
jgi:hypothetical protein